MTTMGTGTHDTPLRIRKPSPSRSRSTTPSPQRIYPVLKPDTPRPIKKPAPATRTSSRAAKPKGTKISPATVGLYIIMMTSALSFQAEATTVQAMIGDIIELESGHSMLTKSSVEFPLVNVYRTAPYESSISHDWHYLHSSCQMHINCTASEPNGIRTSNVFWTKGDKRVSYIRFCRTGLYSVISPVTGSCVEWYVEVSISEKDVSGVMKIGPGKKQSGASMYRLWP